jgi:hypothetical protein
VQLSPVKQREERQQCPDVGRHGARPHSPEKRRERRQPSPEKIRRSGQHSPDRKKDDREASAEKRPSGGPSSSAQPESSQRLRLSTGEPRDEGPAR